MTRVGLTKIDLRVIDELLQIFDQNRDRISLFLDQLRVAISESKKLAPHIHSIRWRIKERDHLKDKLMRKFIEAKTKKKPFKVTSENLLERVTDLAGLRILHLHTRQIVEIGKVLREIFNDQQYDMLEGPFARTWDDESREIFESCGIKTQKSPSMYTSVHYVVGSASRTRVTCEIQVRTLMEEVWGEVEHAINYPYQIGSLPCREQIKVLARVTSSATRLVDSIFMTASEYNSRPDQTKNKVQRRLARTQTKRRK